MARVLRFFHISPEWCGQERLVQLFRLNGHASLCDDQGRLAQDILFSQASGRAPLAQWPRAWLLTGLYRYRPHWQPPLEAWRSFAFLDRHFPQARFVLTTRDPAAWIWDRMTREGGAAARAHAHHRGVAPADLPELWLADWQDHLAAVGAHFGDDPRLIRVDIDRETPQDLCRRLSALLPMPNHPPRATWLPLPEEGQGRGLLGVLDDPAPAARPDEDWVQDVADFCLGARGSQGGGLEGVSRYYCDWDGAAGFRGQGGRSLPLALLDQPPMVLCASDTPFKLQRAQGVVNEILRLGRRDPVRIDMEDSRWMGSPQGGALGLPVLCHNRRHDARDVVLWPLPGQHDIGMPGFDAGAAPDPIPFEDKLDRVVWRGMISGSRMRDGVKPGPASHVYLTRLAAAATDAERAAIWAELSQTSRLAFVRRFWGHPDFDLGVVMAWGFRESARDPLLAPYCVPRRGPDFFRRFRYQLCLGGYDHGSNFIAAINSRSVLLAEEDGWQVYYSGRFKPWKHYIPLVRYGADITEKLQWARENPNECKQMSRAARAEAARFADPALRRALLERILDGLARRG